VHRANLLAVTLLACLAPSAAAQQLSPAERRITGAIEAGVPDALATLERAVNINSGTMNFDGVRAVGRLFATEFERLGFTTRWVDGAPFGRAGHLVADYRGRGRGPKILFIGHLDTVFELDGPFQRWARLGDTTARGPGVTDMKGGNVVMLLALRGLREAGLLDQMQITVVLDGDEENAGDPVALARREITAAAEWADIAIGFEDGPGDPRTAVVGRRGSSGWLLRTSGTPHHSSQIFRPDVGSGAIYEAARILTAFHDSLSAEPNLTFNPGTIVGGSRTTFDVEQSRGTAFGKTNVVAESATVAGDLRTLTPEQLRRTQETMRRLVARHYPHTGAEITFEDRYPPLAPTDGNRRLLALFDQAGRDVGAGPMTAADPARAGAADISFTAGLVDMALDGVGLMGSGGHTVDETADLRTLPLEAKRVAVVLARLHSARSGS
jgi:glutamate carboxypeptidase